MFLWVIDVIMTFLEERVHTVEALDAYALGLPRVAKLPSCQSTYVAHKINHHWANLVRRAVRGLPGDYVSDTYSRGRGKADLNKIVHDTEIASRIDSQ